jgi:hypothetical protein
MTNPPTSTVQKPPNPESSEQLGARIPGWGVDLDQKDRPSVPKERFAPAARPAHTGSSPSASRRTGRASGRSSTPSSPRV